MNQLHLFAVTESGPIPLPVPDAAERFEDLYQGMELGVYSSFRTFEHNKFLDLKHHLQRTERSMERLGWSYSLDQKRLRRSLHEVCTAYLVGEMRVRVDILAQPIAVAGHESRELIGLMPFIPTPAIIYETGVRVATTRGLMRAQPLVKSAGFVEDRQKHIDPRANIYEQLLVNNNDELLEGFSSNFYGVLDGVFYTAKEGILEGITRRIILELITELGIPARFEPIRTTQIGYLEEAAISSSSRGLVPVVGIDDIVVGNGSPGALCQRVFEAYQHFVASSIRRAV